LGKISKMGNPTLRSLLVVGATAVLQHARRGATISPWLTALLARRPAKVAAIALANKMARIVWALLTKGGTFIRKNRAAEPAAAWHEYGLTNWSASPPLAKARCTQTTMTPQDDIPVRQRPRFPKRLTSALIWLANPIANVIEASGP